MSEEMRLIKKYPNRRLYDTKTSAYITLGDVKDLVLKFEPFKVLDAKTGDDLTRGILLQIILEEESGGLPLFSCELLSSFVRFYGSAMQGMLGKYLENNMRTFVDCRTSCKVRRATCLLASRRARCRTRPKNSLSCCQGGQGGALFPAGPVRP